jgi:hypothetical protein
VILPRPDQAEVRIFTEDFCQNAHSPYRESGLHPDEVDAEEVAPSRDCLGDMHAPACVSQLGELDDAVTSDLTEAPTSTVWCEDVGPGGGPERQVEVE